MHVIKHDSVLCFIVQRTQAAILQEQANTLFAGGWERDVLIQWSNVALFYYTRLVNYFSYLPDIAVCVTDSRCSREGVMYVSFVNSCE